MNAKLDTVYQNARLLPPPDLGTLVFRLLEDLSSNLPVTADEDLDVIADEREAEMDADPARAMTHEQMLAFIRSRRA